MRFIPRDGLTVHRIFPANRLAIVVFPANRLVRVIIPANRLVVTSLASGRVLWLAVRISTSPTGQGNDVANSTPNSRDHQVLLHPFQSTATPKR
ncbi:hypothetical protein MESS2_1690003 [Mesorhizobium metallidurans STM 2683]|uniref:Uncharacterized protein n=1 Tax=Mesorhizobium metallidurans STM 2683 TaxID=1297569 RepID=M5ENG7_9HYPH|nr:hypothetical protein MESS2_1690003 [Mesorhizobium metallidurans STM 2683]